MNELKYSDNVSVLIAVIITIINFSLFAAIYKFGQAFINFGELINLVIFTVVFICFTLFVIRPLIKKLILRSE
jgi:hypothetical protein